MKNIVYVIFFVGNACFSQTLAIADSMAISEVKNSKIPGLVISVIDAGQLVHMKAYGYKDLANKEQASVSTSFHIASVSKIVTGLAIFQLVEDGKIELGEDINSYLPFEIRNPHHPMSKITVAQILNHKSGIRDNPKIYRSYWSEPKGDPSYPLNDFLFDYLNESGKLYSKKHFEKGNEFQSSRYSNTGYALLGLVVQHISKKDFSEYCKVEIFDKLEMNNTGWFLRELKIENVSKTYASKDDKLTFLGHNGYPDYPAGQLRTSIIDFSKLLTFLIKSNKSDVLGEAVIRQIIPEMERKNERYTWFVTKLNGNLYYSHGGGDVGVRTMIVIDVEKGNAIAFFANRVFDEKKFVAGLATAIWK